MTASAIDVAQNRALEQATLDGFLSGVPDSVEAGQSFAVTATVTADPIQPLSETFDLWLSFVGGGLASRAILATETVELASGQTTSIAVTVPGQETANVPPDAYDIELAHAATDLTRSLWREPITLEPTGGDVGVVVTGLRVTNQLRGQESELVATIEGVGSGTRTRTLEVDVTGQNLPSITVTRDPGEVEAVRIPFTVPDRTPSGGKFQAATARVGGNTISFEIEDPGGFELLTGVSLEQAAVVGGVLGVGVAGAELWRRRQQ